VYFPFDVGEAEDKSGPIAYHWASDAHLPSAATRRQQVSRRIVFIWVSGVTVHFHKMAENFAAQQNDWSSDPDCTHIRMQHARRSND
jgi:hypothetical protein